MRQLRLEAVSRERRRSRRAESGTDFEAPVFDPVSPSEAREPAAASARTS